MTASWVSGVRLRRAWTGRAGPGICRGLLLV